MTTQDDQLELEGVEVAPTVEELAKDITDITRWLESAEKELDECQRWGKTLEIQVMQGNNNFRCHYINPDCYHMNVEQRLSKYYVRIVKEKMRDARKERERLKDLLVASV